MPTPVISWLFARTKSKLVIFEICRVDHAASFSEAILAQSKLMQETRSNDNATLGGRMPDSVKASMRADHTTHHQIERIIYSFFRYLDDQRYDELTALFAPDGIWHRAGKALRGPQGVKEAMATRPVGFTTRHLITNVVIDLVDNDEALASYYMTVFVHEGEQRPKGPVPLDLPLHVSVFEQRFARSATGWLIKNLSGVATFQR